MAESERFIPGLCLGSLRSIWRSTQNRVQILGTRGNRDSQVADVVMPRPNGLALRGSATPTETTATACLYLRSFAANDVVAFNNCRDSGCLMVVIRAFVHSNHSAVGTHKDLGAASDFGGQREGQI